MTIPLPVETERTFGTGYEDFYTDTNNNLDPAAQEVPPSEDASIDRDNELLSFRPPTYNFTLLDYSLRRTNLSISARLHGMFFMADPPPTPGFNTQASFPELTCYRRNLFQVTGSITLPRSLRYILTDHGDRLPILAQELHISATESVEGHPVKLISVPWKTPLNNAPAVSEEKGEKEPTTIPLDTMSNQDMDADFATFPIAWKRLQFRIATANNGRRRELQQHFVVRIKLVATLSTGAKVPIAEAKSAAVIVRGRSPRNFQQRKDQPVGGEKGTARKQVMQPPATLNRKPTNESASKSPLKREHSSENAFASFDFDLKDSQPKNSFSEWPSTAEQNKPSTPALPTSNFSTPTLPSSNHSSSTPPPPAPQTLSLTDEPDFKRPSPRPTKVPRTSSSSKIARPHPYKHPSLPSLSSTKAFLSSHSQNKISSASLDSADLLYEYFPLGLDDWMPPVDAVYRPHVVHHISMATGAAGARQGIGGRSTRYFSEDTSAS